MKILILGANGLLGNTLFRFFLSEPTFEVFGTVRTSVAAFAFSNNERKSLINDVNVQDEGRLTRLFQQIQPQVVINCTGLTKHRSDGQDHLLAIAINSLLSHQLTALSAQYDARFIHFSTDCVFSGNKGNYSEEDFADAADVYGRSKWLGEVNSPTAITLRTSMIGPELSTQYGLLEWFLAQEKTCRGFTKTIFSGLPTVELARIIKDYILVNPSISGLYHVAANPIAKYDLLKLIAEVYEKSIEIIPDNQLVLDRSLNSSRFEKVSGYRAPDWLKLIKIMHQQHRKKRL